MHQLVRAEFPDLLTIGRRSSIIVKHKDEEKEAKIRKEKYRKRRAQIHRQTGFRWLIEAITGGSLAKIDLAWLAKDPHTGADLFYYEGLFKAKFDRIAANLKLNRPVLVGHNLFTDLVYLYQCFIGELPQTAVEFSLRIHQLFPVIVDTKYMATHNCGNINPASSLDQIEEGLRTQTTPKLGRC